MANITVVELTFDPDFVDPATVLRQMETVGPDGIARRVVVPIQIYASVQAASGDNLLLSPESARVESTYECITAFPLNEATDSTAADEVVWQGMEFTVISVARFGNFANGFGHYEAMMALKPVKPTLQPPQGRWVDGETPAGWVDNGVPAFWDIPGYGVPASLDTWTDTGQPARWRDETTTTVWDVKT